MSHGACAGCQRVVKEALLQGRNPERIKAENGHVEGCNEAESQYWPWAVPTKPVPKRPPIADPQPKRPRKERPEAVNQPEGDSTVQRFKRIDYANRGEKVDQKRGMWLILLVITGGLVGPFLPIAIPFIAGAVLALFIVR